MLRTIATLSCIWRCKKSSLIDASKHISPIFDQAERDRCHIKSFFKHLLSGFSNLHLLAIYILKIKQIYNVLYFLKLLLMKFKLKNITLRSSTFKWYFFRLATSKVLGEIVFPLPRKLSFLLIALCGQFRRRKIIARFIKCNADDVFTNFVNFRLYIFNIHNES